MCLKTAHWVYYTKKKIGGERAKMCRVHKQSECCFQPPCSYTAFVQSTHKKKLARIISTGIAAALKSNMKMRHGAVITNGNRIVAVGYNQRVKHLHNKYSIHAEESALRNLRMRCKNAQSNTRSLHLYVLRVLDNGSLANSSPCQKCQACIRNSGIISKVFYSESAILS